MTPESLYNFYKANQKNVSVDEIRSFKELEKWEKEYLTLCVRYFRIMTALFPKENRGKAKK